ncbi:MAG: hypothetical protein R3B84_22810 [Zavarzinella sp.]
MNTSCGLKVLYSLNVARASRPWEKPMGETPMLRWVVSTNQLPEAKDCLYEYQLWTEGKYFIG